MDLSFTEEQKSIKQNIIAFAQKELNKNVTERDKAGMFSKELWLKCGEQKLQGLVVEEQLGGAALDPLSSMIALEALGYGSHDGGLNFSIAAHFLACVIPVWKYGTEEQKKKYLPDLCSGKKIATNAMTETESGSNAFQLKTSAKANGNTFIINGIKTFCSNAPVADTIIAYAVTDATKGFHGGITAFIVDKNTAGIKTGQTFEKMGLRTSTISELIFENVSVPAENVLGGVGGGATVFNHSMEWERTGMAAMHIGTMKRVMEQTIHYAQNRKTGDEVIAKKQAIAHKLVDLQVKLEASRMLTYKAVLGLENQKNNGLNASVAKLYVSEAFVSMTTECMNIYGGNGYMSGYEIERIVRDALGSTIYSGTSDIQRNIIAGWLGL